MAARISPTTGTACHKRMAFAEETVPNKLQCLGGHTCVKHIFLNGGSEARQEDGRKQFIPFMFFLCLIGRPEIRLVPVISLRMQILIRCLLNA